MWKHKSKSKGCKWPKNCGVAILLSLIVLVLWFCNNAQNHISSFISSRENWESYNSLVQLYPTRELRNRMEVIWQTPSSPKAALFLAHGCNCKAVNFWDKSPNCPQCIGLPEDRLIVLNALARKFAVLTISSSSRCWKLGKEILIVKEIIEWWIVKNKLENIPLMAMGASSGGYFVSMLATELKFSSIILMVAEGMFNKIDIKQDYPPTLFVHMPKDQNRKLKIDKYKKVLINKGVDVGEIKCMPFPLSPSFLADRIPDLDQKVSSKLLQTFQDKGFIDKNGYMRKDGRATRWREALSKSQFFFPYKHLTPHIQEELNLAFAYHEMTSLHSEEIFKWFESHSQPSL